MTRLVQLAAFFSTQTLDHLLNHFGYAAVFLFVMVESLGVPFPGETMVITAALYAGTTHHLDVWLIWAAAAGGAIVGDNIGYAIGYWGGYPLLRKLHVNETKLKVGRLLFDRYGGQVVFFGRFVSVLRTYAAFLAGVNRMEWRRFFMFNAAGGVLWSGIYSVGFYYAGDTLKRFRGTVDIVIAVAAAVIIIVSVVWARRHTKRLEQEAEAAYPGSLDDEPVQKAA